MELMTDFYSFKIECFTCCRSKQKMVINFKDPCPK